ncbi:hypothetical protein ACOSP7_010118 [Xanthoceras sorbifolium]
MGWIKKGVFSKFSIPMICHFTFGTCATALEWGAWKCQAFDIKTGEIRPILRLAEEMALTYSDLKRKSSGPLRGREGGLPKLGDRPPWVSKIEGSVTLMFNTCDDLDGPFIKYMANQMGMLAWGVGPLLSEQVSSISQCIRRVNPEFIWVVQPGSNRHVPHGLENRVESRGLIIYGWAPQLLILSHKLTKGFLSHCGLNSTMEAIGGEVPFLVWPIRGDQYFNAKLVVSHLKVGYREDDIVNGIERLMGDHEMKKSSSNAVCQICTRFSKEFNGCF